MAAPPTLLAFRSNPITVKPETSTAANTNNVIVTNGNNLFFTKDKGTMEEPPC
jgi:hypothetical protein